MDTTATPAYGHSRPALSSSVQGEGRVSAGRTDVSGHHTHPLPKPSFAACAIWVQHFPFPHHWYPPSCCLLSLSRGRLQIGDVSFYQLVPLACRLPSRSTASKVHSLTRSRSLIPNGWGLRASSPPYCPELWAHGEIASGASQNQMLIVLQVKLHWRVRLRTGAKYSVPFCLSHPIELTFLSLIAAARTA